MATITATNTLNAQSNLFASAREFYANEYKDKNLTHDELSAAVVVNIMNCLPTKGGIESSRWATKDTDDAPVTSFHKKNLPKKDHYSIGSYKKESKNTSFQQRTFNNGLLQKGASVKDAFQDNLSLVSQPLCMDTKVISSESLKSRGFNPLANEFVPSKDIKCSAVKGGLSTSIYAAKASGANIERTPSPPVARSPEREKKSWNCTTHHERSQPVTVKIQHENSPAYLCATKDTIELEQGILPKNNQAASVTTENPVSKASPKSNKFTVPLRTEAREILAIDKISKSRFYIPPHRQPDYGKALKNKPVTAANTLLSNFPTKENRRVSGNNRTSVTSPARKNKVVTTANRPHTTAPAKRGSNNNPYQIPKALALQGDVSKSSSSSPSSSSGASAWKNYRAIIAEDDRAYIEQRKAEYNNKTERLPVTIKDTWIPTVVEDGKRTLKQTIITTLSGVTTSAASSDGDGSAVQTSNNHLGVAKPTKALNCRNAGSESNSLDGYVLCDWGETTNGESILMDENKAEANEVDKFNLDTAAKAMANLIGSAETLKGGVIEVDMVEQSEVVKDDVAEITSIEICEVVVGNKVKSAMIEQVQTQDNQILNSIPEPIDVVLKSQSICGVPDCDSRSAVSLAKKSCSVTHNKLQIDRSESNGQEDDLIPKGKHTSATNRTNPCDSPGVLGREKIQAVKVSTTVEVNTAVVNLTKSDTNLQSQTDISPTSNATMNVTLPLPTQQGGRLATSWEEFTCGTGRPADFKSYRFQKNDDHVLGSVNAVVKMKTVKNPIEQAPEIVTSKGRDQQICQASESMLLLDDVHAIKESAGLKSEISEFVKDQRKQGKLIESGDSSTAMISAEQPSSLLSEAATLSKDQEKVTEALNPVIPIVTTVPSTQVGWLASTWEEFNCGKGNLELPTSYRLRKLPSHTSISSRKVKDLSTEVPRLLKGVSKSLVQECKVSQHQTSGKGSNRGSSSSKKGSSAAITDMHSKNSSVRENDQSAEVEAIVYPQTMLHNVDNVVKRGFELETPAQVHAALLKEITDPKCSGNRFPLTRTNLMEIIGSAPLETSCWGVEKAVSDDGIEKGNMEVKDGETNDQQASDIRNLLIREQCGIDLWEGDRAEVDLSYMQPYIKSWAGNTPTISKPIDTTCDEFKTGLWPLSNMKFEKPIAQPLSYPNLTESENIQKARVQTAENECKYYLREKIRSQRRKDRGFTTQIARNSTLFQQATPVDPNAPVISCHLRPAEERDIPGITAIYNHYVNKSFLPEDQKSVSEQEMLIIWQTARKESLPFIVAIKGPSLDHNNPYRETVIGYARADVYYGFGGEAKGRSRYLGILELYTHNQYLRKGIGRSLLDRILCITSTSYLQKGGYEWVIPNEYDNAVYNSFGGGSPRRWHQLLIYRPIEVNDDPDYAWLKDWLRNKFYFFEVARLRSVARTKPVGGPARWLDVVTFQLEASTPGEFEAFH